MDLEFLVLPDPFEAGFDRVGDGDEAVRRAHDKPSHALQIGKDVAPDVHGRKGFPAEFLVALVNVYKKRPVTHGTGSFTGQLFEYDRVFWVLPER